MTQEMTTFSHKVIEALDIIMEQEGNDALLNIEEIDKNGSIKVGISFKAIDDPVAPVVYLEKFLEEYNEGEKELEDIAYDIYDTYLEGTRSAKEFEQQDILKDLMNWETVKDRLIVQLVCSECNVDGIPHISLLDMKCIARVVINLDSDGVQSIKVNDELLKRWNVTNEELFETAFKAMNHSYPVKVKDMVDIFAESFGKVPEFMEEAKGRMYVVSNSIKLNGAIYGFDKKLLKAFCTVKDIQEVYILPSSISECIWLPGDKVSDSDELSNMVEDVNTNSLEEEDRLSDHAYKYSMNTDEIVSI